MIEVIVCFNIVECWSIWKIKESKLHIFRASLFAQSTRVSVSFVRITIQTCKGTTKRTHCEWNMFVYISFWVRALACSITHSCNTVYGRKTLARFVKRQKSDIVFVSSFPTFMCIASSRFSFPLSFWILIKLHNSYISLPALKLVYIAKEICIKEINNACLYISRYCNSQHFSPT